MNFYKSRLILFLICAPTLCACAESNKIQYERNYSPESAQVEIRLAAFDSNASMRIAPWRKQREDTSEIFVAEKPIISTHDILGTSLTESVSDCGHGFGLFIFFRPEAEARLQKFSEMHIGDHVAMLINNEVDSVIQIRSTILSSKLLLCEPFASADQAKVLARLISGQ
ncbi:hypothetical protein [Vogesella sp. EB]|uniref:hypothetical protein n=1 Tax=Vogesella sp. EB TaxID=1526735 RepID=UPI0012E0060C|nr:hypothetical protein [Vogesella sp. EB]